MLAAWYFMVGSVLGSFAGVVSYRIPRGESLNGRSRCVCGRKLLWWENVPIVGYLFFKGRSRCCGEPIGASTILMEAGYGVGALIGMGIAGPLGAAGMLALMLSFTFSAAYNAKEEPPDE